MFSSLPSDLSDSEILYGPGDNSTNYSKSIPTSLQVSTSKKINLIANDNEKSDLNTRKRTLEKNEDEDIDEDLKNDTQKKQEELDKISVSQNYSKKLTPIILEDSIPSSNLTTNTVKKANIIIQSSVDEILKDDENIVHEKKAQEKKQKKVNTSLKKKKI